MKGVRENLLWVRDETRSQRIDSAHPPGGACDVITDVYFEYGRQAHVSQHLCAINDRMIVK